MIHIGIDPGLQGAVAALDDEGALLWVRDMPVCAEGVDGAVLADLLEEVRVWDAAGSFWERPVATVEHQVPVRNQGVVQTAKQHFGYGLICGVLAGLGIEYETVPPRVWQASQTKGFPGANAKQRARTAAPLLFPGADLEGPKGGFRDGRADALLICKHGRDTWQSR